MKASIRDNPDYYSKVFYAVFDNPWIGEDGRTRDLIYLDSKVELEVEFIEQKFKEYAKINRSELEDNSIAAGLVEDANLGYITRWRGVIVQKDFDL